MGIKDWFHKKSNNNPDLNTNDIVEGLSIDHSRSSASNVIRNFIVKGVGFINRETYRREVFQRPEYNLLEIKEASEADSYIKIALSKYSYLIYKAG